jgi:transcriptional regulator with XRE-family HTH domain
MGTETKIPAMHTGKKVERIREILGMKQETLAGKLGVSQQAISKMEQSEHIEDGKLKEVALALGVSPEAIKNFNEEAVINNINTFNDSSALNDYSAILHYQCNFNPIEKIVELYERMLQLEKEKSEFFESMLKNKE